MVEHQHDRISVANYSSVWELQWLEVQEETLWTVPQTNCSLRSIPARAAATGVTKLSPIGCFEVGLMYERISIAS
jgi:hypothetical protein